MKHILPIALMMLAVTGCETVSKPFAKLGQFSSDLVNSARGETPVKAARQMEDAYFPDERREGINKLADRQFGLREPYVDRYRQIAQYDSDYSVRAIAIRALNRSRDAASTPVFIAALTDKADLVRLEAAKALNRVPDEKAIPGLIRLLADENENKDVRIAAAEALRNYRSLAVARTLASTLVGRDFGVAWQSRQSLQSMTGRDFSYDEGAWLQFLTGAEKPVG